MYVNGIKQTINEPAVGYNLCFSYRCGNFEGSAPMTLKMDSPAAPEVEMELPESSDWTEIEVPWPGSLTGQPITIGFHCFPCEWFDVDNVRFTEQAGAKKFNHGPWNQIWDPLTSEFIKIRGQVTDVLKPVRIDKKEENTWITVGEGTTDANGVFEIPIPTSGYFLIDKTPGKEDHYRLYIDSVLKESKFIASWKLDGYFPDPKGNVPQYSTYWNYVPSNLLIQVNRIEELYSKNINRVIVYGQSETGDLYEQTIESPEVQSGEEKAIEYVFESKDLNTQSKVDILATYLFNAYNKSILRFEAEFKLRTDLQLLQKIKFIGYEDIPEEEMRITNITYQRKAADTRVKIGFIPANQPLSSLRLESTDLAMSDIIDDATQDVSEIEVGTVVSVSGSTATVDLESGARVQARILNP